MTKNYKYLFTTVEGCVLSSIILSIACMVILYMAMGIVEKRTLRPITEQTGINNWRELERYMDETFVEGMSREEVYRELEKFGDYKVPPNSQDTGEVTCEVIGLPTGDPVIYSNLEYVACFSVDDDILVSWSLHD